ncbi:PucR family transcriptional regulator [Nocardioides sp. AN3]
MSDVDLRRSLERNVARVVATINQQEELPPQVEEDERATGRRRAMQGIPIESVVDAYRSHLALLRDAFMEEATAIELDPEAVLGGIRRLWDLADHYAGVLTIAHHEAELAAARRNEQQRLVFLHRLLMGALDRAELRDRGAVLGILTNQEYWVVRGRQTDGGTNRLIRHLEATATGSESRPLIGPVDQDVAGVSTRRPTPLDGAVIAVTGPVDVSSIPAAFAEATRVLRVALRYRRSGVVDSSSLSVRIAVEQQPELGEILHGRYVKALRSQGSAGADILATVRTWMQQRRSIQATAHAMSIHENTVRYRLGRFSELTNADVADADSLVEVWWALEYESILEQPPAGASFSQGPASLRPA